MGALKLTACMKVVSKMGDMDQEALLERLDRYTGDGVPKDRAQVMAASDALAELQDERRAFMRLLREQHPEIFMIPAAKQLEIDKNGTVRTNSEEVLAAIRDAGDRRESVDSRSALVESRRVGSEDTQGASNRQTGPGAGDARLRDGNPQDDVYASSGAPTSLAERLAELGGARIEDQELVDYLASTSGGFGAHGVGINTLKRALVTKAAIQNGVIETSQQGLLFSLPRPAFYSQLQRSIEQVPDRLATMAAPQWKLWLDANASKLGIKKDEIEWSGITDYLELRGKDKLSREDLVAYLADSGVRVQEAVLGNQNDRQKLSDEYGRAVAASDAAGGAMNPVYIESLAPGDRRPEEQALLDAWNRVNENPDESWLPEAGNPKYGRYTIPGGPLSRDTEILTRDGWMRMDEVQIGDEVMTRRDEDGGLEWQPVEELPTVYAEKLYHFKNQSINMRVTPCHKMVVKRRRRSTGEIVRVTAEQLWGMSEMVAPLTGSWGGGEFSDLFDQDPGDVAELLGWFIAEGHYKTEADGKKSTIGIAQCRSANSDKCARIESLLGRMGIAWNYSGGQYWLGVKKMSADLVQLLHAQGKAAEKYVPGFMFNAPASVIQRMLDGLLLGDGCLVKQNGRKPRWTYHTKSKQLADDVQVLALLVGKRGTVSRRKTGLYTVTINDKQWASIDDAKHAVVDYNDIAYCVTVKNHSIYVRTNGVAAFTGNSNYREVLITLPDGRTPAPERAARPRVVDRGRDDRGRAQFEVVQDGEVVDIFSNWAEAQDRALEIEEEENIRRNLEWRKSQPVTYKSDHWDQPNILAHLRVDERVDADGASVLFVQELQSDAGQDKRKGKTDWKAPFIDDTKAWVALALKRAIMLAVEGGHDKVALITGAQAADLYDLSKQISKVEATKMVQGKYAITASDLNGTRVLDDIYGAGALPDVVGKELAERIVAEAGTSAAPGKRHSVEYSGLDLKVGGEGMRAFYDQIVPQVARDVLKKLGGGKLEAVYLGSGADNWSIVDATDDGGGAVLQDGFQSRAAAEAAQEADLDGGTEIKNLKAAASQPGFTITPAMREKVSTEGLPLFSKRRDQADSVVERSLPRVPGLNAPDERTTGDYGREYTPQQLAMFKNVGRTTTKPALIDRLKEARKDLGRKMAQGIVDQFRPIRDLGGNAYTLARLSKGSAGAFEALLGHGKLKIVDGAYDADTTGGFLDRVGKPLGKELEDFMFWVASNRAESLSIQDRENLFTQEDIDAGKSLADGDLEFDYLLPNGAVTRDRRAAYEDSLAKFNEFNKNVLDIAEESGLIDGDSRQYWEGEFYVPFYRVSEDDGEFVGAKIKGGLARQRAFHELKGGSQKLNSDLLANTMRNWAHLIDASAKNRAAKATLEAAQAVGIALESDAETVRQLGKSMGGKGGTVWFMDGGQQRHFLIGDPYLLEAINSLEYAGLRGPLMDALSTMKHWLTVGVTASPAFKVRNLIRDSIQAISLSGLSYNPVKNLVEGYKATDRASQDYVSALASGGLIRFGTMLEGNAAERVRRLVQKGVPASTILNTPGKVKDFYGKFVEPAVEAYQELGNRGEEINRASLYKQLRAQGVNHAEASLMARDLMDFSMQGTWTSIRFLTQVVPFLNARLQGLYKLGRGAAEDPKRFAMVAGATALVSIALLGAYGDDDDWKKREDWDRDGFWWFKFGGTAFRIPKPFEVGAIATLAERGVELFTNDEFTAKRFGSRVMHLLGDNLAMNPIPQAVKPMLDIYANKDSFSGRPIESMGMERLKSEYRFNVSTSMVARGASTALNTVTGAVGGEALSPVQIDHLVRAYFGWLGTFVVAGADMAIRPLTSEPARPQADYLKVVTQGFLRTLPEPGSKYVSAMYDQAKIMEQAYATHRQLLKEGKVDEAREFAAENKDLMERYRLIESVKKVQSGINRRIREIEISDMEPSRKREEIRRLRDQADRSARAVY